MIIGISGKKQSGKDTVARMIQYITYNKEKYPNPEKLAESYLELNDILEPLSIEPPFKIVRFADKLKEITSLLTGCHIEQLESEEFKNSPLSKEWWYYKHIFRDTKIPYRSQKVPFWYILIKPTYRIFMQKLGTDCGRNMLHPNIWVNTTMQGYKLGDNWIIPDVRFENEINAIRQKGGSIIRVNRKTKIKDKHSSETSLDNYNNFSWVIDNNSTLEDLFLEVYKILYGR